MKKIFLSLGVSGLILSASGCSLTEPASVKPGSGTPIIGSSKVDLSRRGLDRLETSIFDQSGVTEFDVSGNRLTGALPSELGKWTGLERLDASDNDMTGIPAEIGRLKKLKVLDYGNNRIDTMPNEIVQLANLERLSLAGNLYREVPATLLELPKLSSLDLSGNRLAKLPDNLAPWQNLRSLNLAGNPLPAAEVARARQALPSTEVNF